MQKKIATLEVFYDDSRVPSRSGQDSPTTFHIIMTPGSPEIPINTKARFQATLAHELGHFVALLTRDETHNPINHLTYQSFMGDSSSLLPREYKAWAIAKEIIPDLDREQERKCLQSYEKQAR
jgi:hypothetical protein